jgi:hypothetical protein
VLTWSVGTWQQATNLMGAWAPGGATSPCANRLTAPQMFFRVSNP